MIKIWCILMEMTKLSCIMIIIITILLLFTSSFLEVKQATTSFLDESSLLEARSRQWVEYLQNYCPKELAILKKEFGECDLFVSLKLVETGITSCAVLLKQRGPHKTLTNQQSNLQEHVFGSIRKKYHLFSGSQQENGFLRFRLHQSAVPRRYLADKSSKAPSSNDASGKEQNQHLNNIVTTAASIAGAVVIFALVLFCCVLKGRNRFRDTKKDDKPLLTSSSCSSTSSGIQGGGRHSGLNVEGQGTSVSGIGGHDPNAAGISGGLLSEKLSPENLPPPPPPAAAPPAAPPPPIPLRPPPVPPIGRGKRRTSSGASDTTDPDGPRTKLKPFFWDKVVGNSEHSMVWDEIRAGSFQFNEEMIESLFGCNADDHRSKLAEGSQLQFIQIIDAKKAQNLSILLKALNVTTEEIRDALLEGNELPAELLQTLLRMAPTQEEELMLRLYTGDVSQITPAERFLKVLVDIPYVSKRMESLMFMMTYKEEVSNVKESFVILEVACDELKRSRLFLKLLEAVLKTGNRMNNGTYRGGAQAFKLDTLLKLADVKGTDGKTTLLHFVVQEIIRTEGLKAVRAAKDNDRHSISNMKTDDFVEDSTFDPIENYHTLGLQVVSGISSELENVRKAAFIDGDALTSTVSKLGQSVMKIKKFLENEMENCKEDSGLYQALVSFVEHSESEETWLLEEEQRISDLVRKTADYFHGNAGREEGLRLFIIVRDFLVMLDRICSDIKSSMTKQEKSLSKESSKNPSPSEHQSIKDMRQKFFPAIADRRVDISSSDSDDD